MDDYSGKRAVNGFLVSRRASSSILKDTANTRDRNAQLSSRAGCSGRSNTKGNQVVGSEKAKTSRLPSHYLAGKGIAGSSSRACSSVSKPRKSSAESWREFCIETDSSERSSIHDHPETSELMHHPGKIKKGFQAKFGDDGSNKSMTIEEGTSSVALNTRSRRINRKPGAASQETSTSPMAPSASKNTSQAPYVAASRYGLRNLKCNSISDVITSGPSLDTSLNKRKDVVKKRYSEGESSSFGKGKRISGPQNWRNPNSVPGICISETREARNGLHDGEMSVGSQRSFGSTRVRLSNQGSRNRISTIESHIARTPIPQSEAPIGLNTHISSRQLSIETSNRRRSFNRPSTRNLQAVMSPGSPEFGMTQSPRSCDSLEHSSIDNIGEVLLELERIEQDEELTYEQMLLLDSYLFLNSLNSYDQHRDMRLDIDNMSYEELLALEERMGTVSTALSEEALSKCLTIGIHEHSSPGDGTCSAGDIDDIKCSICQEEYAAGDETARLQCEHKYHVACIQQWLRLKNWCPICKASAEPSHSDTSSYSCQTEI